MRELCQILMETSLFAFVEQEILFLLIKGFTLEVLKDDFDPVRESVGVSASKKRPDGDLSAHSA